MLLSAVSVLVVAQSSSEIPEGLMNNPVVFDYWSFLNVRAGSTSYAPAVFKFTNSAFCSHSLFENM